MTTVIKKPTTQTDQSQDSAVTMSRILGVLGEIGKYVILIPLAITFMFPIYWMFG